MAKKQKAPPGPVPEGEILVGWHVDERDENGGWWGIISSLDEADDGQIVAVYDLNRIGKAKRTTELV